MIDHTFQPKKLLLVDDNKNFIYAFSKLLARDGFEILTAKNGFEGLELIGRSQPDLILCDMMMPVMSGFEFIQALKEQDNSREIPFICVTAKTSSEDRERALKLGALNFITKPFEYSELLKEITKAFTPAPVL